jgi:pyruvate dehydrogenase E1 component alpha subunit
VSLSEDIATLRAADVELSELGPQPFALPTTGLEQVIAGSVRGLSRGDWWLPGLRERVGAVLRDVPVTRLVDGFAGARPYRVAPPTPSPALRALHAVGLALSHPDKATLVHLGIGSAADGAFYEALNLAALMGARVIFVVAVHPLEGAPVPKQTAAAPSALAEAAGVRTVRVSGLDAEAVLSAVAAARDAEGPTLIEASLASPENSQPTSS